MIKPGQKLKIKKTVSYGNPSSKKYTASKSKTVNTNNKKSSRQVYTVRKGETIGEIAENFDMAMPSISKHLSVLHEAGLVRQQKRGQHVLYFLAADHAANALYGFLSAFCQDARRISEKRKAKYAKANSKKPGS